MSTGLSFGHRRLMQRIIETHWGINNPNAKQFNYNEMLYILQELFEEEGKKYFEPRMSLRGHNVFRHFVKHLLYRNIANYDSMVLITSEKGTGKSSAAIMMARNWCSLLGIRFNPARHIAYNNADVMRKIDVLNKFEPIVCVTGDSRINIRQQNIKKIVLIQDLVNMENYEVLSYNIQNNKFEYQTPTTGAVFNKKEIVYEVELKNDIKIYATNDHKFLTTPRGYIKLKDLKETDRLIDNKKALINIRYIKKKNVRKVYDIVGMPNGNFVCNGVVISNCDEAIRFACVVGSSLIKTPQGNIPIKELEGKKEFEVISYNEKTEKEEVQTAGECVKVKEDVVYEIETVDGNKIQATKEHKFLTTKGWKMLSELDVGDDIIGV